MVTVNGFITLDRKLLNWEWYTDVNTKALFIHLLLVANFADAKFRGEIIKRGSVATTLKELSQQTELTIQNIRTSLNRLKSTQEITIKTSPKYSVISITKYDDYQRGNKQSNKRLTNNQQTGGAKSNKPKNKEDIMNKEEKRILYNNARTREKIHNFPEREYNFEELTKRVKKKGGDSNDDTSN